MKITQIGVLCLAFVCLVGCADFIDDIDGWNPDILAPGDGIIEEAQIQSVEIRIAESFPVQVFVAVIGIAPDTCTVPYETHETRDGNTITIQMTTIRPKDAVCATVITEYMEVIPLGRFLTGDYTVIVNGVKREFHID